MIFLTNAKQGTHNSNRIDNMLLYTVKHGYSEFRRNRMITLVYRYFSRSDENLVMACPWGNKCFSALDSSLYPSSQKLVCLLIFSLIFSLRSNVAATARVILAIFPVSQWRTTSDVHISRTNVSQISHDQWCLHGFTVYLLLLISFSFICSFNVYA